MLAAAGFLAGCGRQPLTRVEEGNRDGILHLGNGAEPRELDPALSTGIPEANVLYALYEGLVCADARDLSPTPGAAERWEVSDDKLTYTFHLRENARWSNGAPLTAGDFVRSWQRALAPRLANELSYYLYVLKNAEAYNREKLADFSQVGVHAVDERTLRLDLEHPTPYLFRLLLQRYFYPVYLPAVAKGGALDDRSNLSWTRPENMVTNGPFTLARWEVNQVIAVKKNPLYWNAAKIRLNEVRFYALDNTEAEEKAFRAGLIHKTASAALPPAKLDYYREKHPELLRTDPFLGIYYYMFNTRKAPLDDVRVRRALAMSIDRESIVRTITRGGQAAVGAFTPPDTAGYTSRAQIPHDPVAARKLLAEAGHPGGAGLPPLEILLNTQETHRQIAEAIQAMWKKELGVTVRLSNQEWKVYLDSRRTGDYQIARAAWIGSLDPSFFLENYLTDGGNNQTGFASAEFDGLIRQARDCTDPAARYEFYQRAEALLLDAAPVAPVYAYNNPYLLSPAVKGWFANPVDYHSYTEVFLQP